MATGGKQIRAGAAFVELSLRDKLFNRGLDAAARRLQSLGASIGSIGKGFLAAGAAIVAPLLGAAKVAADLAGQYDDMSKRTGVSVEALSTLGYAAEQSALSLGTLEGAFRRLNMFMDSASQGSGETRQTLSQLQLSYEQLAKSSPEDQFRTLIRQLAMIENRTVRSAYAMRVFGKAGYALGPLLEAGADGMAALEERARKLGLELSAGDVAASDEFGDRMQDLTTQFKALTASIGNAVVPIISELLEHWLQFAGEIATWIKEHRGLISSIFKVGVALAGVGAALIVLGKIVAVVGVAVAILGGALSFLLSPVGLVVAAVAGVVGAFVYFGDHTGGIVDYVVEKFNSLLGWLRYVGKGISDALAMGNWALAARIAWLALKVTWKEGIAYLLDKWYSFGGMFVDAWHNVVSAISLAMILGWAGLQKMWVYTLAVFEKLWSKFTNKVRSSWANTKDFLGAGLVELEYRQGKISKEEYTKKLREIRDGIVDREEFGKEEERNIEAKKRAQIDEINERRDGMRKQLAEEAAREQKARDAARQRAREEDRAEVDRAKQELQDAIDEAARNRVDDDEEKKLDVRKQLSMAESRFEVAGTFSAASVRGMTIGSSVQEQTLDATKQVAKNTRKIAERLDESDGPVFE